jgi:NitT/TauT family transport system permease protein
MKKFLLYFVSPACAFALWEIMTRTGVLDARFFPAPSAIFYHLLFVSPEQGIMRDIKASLSRIVWGYSAGTLLGITLGMAMGLYRPVKTALYPLIASLYPIPKIAVLPLIMLIFGIGEMSKIVVVAIGSFFLVLLNTLHGVENIGRIHHDVAKVFGISRYNFIFRVILPGALPAIFTGLKLAVGYSLVIVVAAEFSGANAGIGYLIWQSWETFSIKSMYAAIVVIGILGAAFAYTLELLERWLIPWQNKRQ